MEDLKLILKKKPHPLLDYGAVRIAYNTMVFQNVNFNFTMLVHCCIQSVIFF